MAQTVTKTNFCQAYYEDADRIAKRVKNPDDMAEFQAFVETEVAMYHFLLNVPDFKQNGLLQREKDVFRTKFESNVLGQGIYARFGTLQAGLLGDFDIGCAILRHKKADRTFRCMTVHFGGARHALTVEWFSGASPLTEQHQAVRQLRVRARSALRRLTDD